VEGRMKLLDLHAHFSRDEWETMTKKYGTEYQVKVFLSKKLDLIIENECTEIENQIALGLIKDEEAS
jgi:hypothetical protein